MKKYQFSVVGGGMVGAAIALGLAKQGRNVALIEQCQPIAFDASQPMDLRISAISMASVQLLDELGAWNAIAAMRTCAYKGLETWEHPSCITSFDAQELNLPQLGYMVENRLIQLGLWQQFEQYPNLELFTPESISDIEFGDGGHLINLDSGKQLVTDWLVGADGANSRIRQWAKIGITAWDYRQDCMLINVETELAQNDVTWQQFFPSGPRSYLPLQGNQASLVWYDSPQRIRQLSRMSAEQLGAEIEAHFPERLGKIKVLDHGCFPLVRRHAQQYVKQRCILAGDSAHTINPLAGQGVNLGFKDVKELLKQTEKLTELNDAVFERYQRVRTVDNLVMQSGMDLFYKAFSNDILPLKLARNVGLKLAQNAGPLKQQALKYALGL
jgi:2-octaprenyl-3-methyl-6-methoxy-1,4-benzoquinol hydroxylase